MKIILKVLAGIFGLVAVLLLILLMAMSVVDSPGYAWRVLTMLRSDIQDYKVFPSREVANGTTFSQLASDYQLTPQQVTYRYKDEPRTEILDELLERTGTHAFLIVKDDRLILKALYESSRSEINTSFSVAKSFNSALIEPDRRWVYQLGGQTSSSIMSPKLPGVAWIHSQFAICCGWIRVSATAVRMTSLLLLATTL